VWPNSSTPTIGFAWNGAAQHDQPQFHTPGSITISLVSGMSRDLAQKSCASEVQTRLSRNPLSESRAAAMPAMPPAASRPAGLIPLNSTVDGPRAGCRETNDSDAVTSL